jgi:hypothetical protein
VVELSFGAAAAASMSGLYDHLQKAVEGNSKRLAADANWALVKSLSKSIKQSKQHAEG